MKDWRTNVATQAETLEFCNRIREASDTDVDVLDGLMPGEPHEPDRCLIAVNLNFGCDVSPLFGERVSVRYSSYVSNNGNAWGMTIDDDNLAARIAARLGLPFDAEYGAIVLPVRIANVAYAFDKQEEVGGTDEFGLEWITELDESRKLAEAL